MDKIRPISMTWLWAESSRLIISYLDKKKLFKKRRNEIFIAPADTYRKASLSRKTSAPDAFISLTEVLSGPEQAMSPRTRRRGIVDDLFASPLDRKSSESLAGVSRFSKLLRSFRSGQSSPEPHPTISWLVSEIKIMVRRWLSLLGKNPG
ncbi:hypothetical protein ANCDUO_14923 [Ancylostoma duodenale]|uniref:Uncharacterized protein n=1 Tax=Ancylostoma duodenale TaxID=51022 RepID=A0A0C2CYM8_9BILA|nr:hypothetical protein ANCDUO_14923 [Ancylostoma duodenale]